MERMTKVDENIQTAQNMLSGIVERCYELEEENKKLRDYVDNLDSENDNQAIEIEELKNENKKLKSDLAYERSMLDNVRAEYKSLQNVIKKLKDRINELIGKIDQLEEENENLRKDLFHLTNDGKSK